MQLKRTLKGRDLPILDRVALLLLFLFLLGEAAGGAIRYYAVRIHMPWLPYAPHLLLAVGLLPMLAVYLVSEGVTTTFMGTAALFGVATLWGALNLGSAAQVEFGLWVLVPFLYGIVVLPYLIRGWRRIVPYALCLWLVVISGVLINVFRAFPWVGFEYQVGSTVINASKLWRLGGLGFVRLSGFGRAPGDTAIEILLLAIFLWETLRGRWRMMTWILSGTTIVLTTHKTSVVVFLFFSIMWWLFKDTRRPVWRKIPLIALFFDIALPFWKVFASVAWLQISHTPAVGMAENTFIDRLKNGWPETLRMIMGHGNAILGRGIGGVGAPQAYFEPALTRPADSVVMFLFGSFGLLGIVLVCIYAWKASQMPIVNRIAEFFFLCACFLLLEGTMVDAMEIAFSGCALGASFRYLLEWEALAYRPVLARSRKSTSRTAKPTVWGGAETDPSSISPNTP